MEYDLEIPLVRKSEGVFVEEIDAEGRRRGVLILFDVSFATGGIAESLCGCNSISIPVPLAVSGISIN